jgi:biotin carboxylase
MNNQSEATILLIESNTSGTGVVFANIAHQEGLKVILLTDNPDRYNFEAFIQIKISETSNYEAMVKEVEKLSASHRIVGITSTSDYYVEMATRLAGFFNLPHPSLPTILKCRNKLALRDHFKENELRVPVYHIVKSKQDLEQLPSGDELKYPLVAKPVTGSGSIGVKLISNYEELATHAGLLLQKERNERNQLIDSSVLLEEYIEGEEFSLEIFDGEIVGITRKHKSGLPFFIETGHDFPYHSDTKLYRHTELLLQKLKNILDLSWGAYHIEFIWNNEEIIIIEINPRLAGGFIPRLIQNSFGLDLLKLGFRKVIGETVDLTQTRSSFSSIRFIIPELSGIIEYAFENMDFQNSEAEIEYKMYRKSGDSFQINSDFRDRIAHVVSTHDRLEVAQAEAGRALKEVQKRISIKNHG